MRNSKSPIIDMRPDGTILTPQKPSLALVLLRLAAFGVFLCIAALLFWTALLVLPFLLLLGVIGYFALRAEMRRGGGRRLWRMDRFRRF